MLRTGDVDFFAAELRLERMHLRLALSFCSWHKDQNGAAAKANFHMLFSTLGGFSGVSDVRVQSQA